MSGIGNVTNNSALQYIVGQEQANNISNDKKNSEIQTEQSIESLAMLAGAEALEKIEGTSIDKLGQSKVTEQDMAGIEEKVSFSFGEAPQLPAPKEQALASGKNALFGASTAMQGILELMVKMMEVSNSSRQIQREVSTTQQNLSIKEGLQAADKMMQSADKMQTQGIINAVVGGLGVGISATGATGLIGGAKSALKDAKSLNGTGNNRLDEIKGVMKKYKEDGVRNKTDTNIAKKEAKKEMKEEKLLDKRDKELEKTEHYIRRQQEAVADNQYIGKRENLAMKHHVRKTEKYENKLNGNNTKMDNAKRSEIFQAVSEMGSATISTTQQTTNTTLQSQQKIIEAQSQVDNMESETAKAERSKFEAQYDGLKQFTASTNRIFSELLSAMNSAAATAARNA